jgi:hypothetical protein
MRTVSAKLKAFCALWVVVGSIAILFAIRFSAIGADTPSHVPWDEIKQIASDFVARESPASVWPFEEQPMGAGKQKVYIHYFTPLPLTPDNKPAAYDYWNTQALVRSGIGGKYSEAGGYLRERPLPVGPWPSPYWREINASIDVLRAKLIGADGFIVGLFQLPPGPHWLAAQRLCETAAAVAPGFTVVPQLDADALPEATPEQMVDSVAGLLNCRALEHVRNGRLLVTVFDPARRSPSFWQAVVSIAQTRGIPLALMPILLNPIRSAEPLAALSYGLSYWGAADPNSIEGPGSGEPLVHALIERLTSQWMAPVRPQDFRPKNGLVFEAANTKTFRGLWGYAIQKQAPFVHIITWNDYTESSEIEPSSHGQYLWYDLSRYFIAWYKTGNPPPIRRDAIYYSYREQIFTPEREIRHGDITFRLLGLTPTQNQVEMVALLTAPASLEVSVGGNVCRRKVPSGLAVLECPAKPGFPTFRIVRAAGAGVEMRGAWEIQDRPDRADGLYGGGSSTRPTIDVPLPARD